MYRLFFCVISTLSVLAHANTEAPEGIEQFKSRLDAIESLSGQFEQSIVDKAGQAVQENSSGQFSLKRPGYFLWESKEPFNQLVVGTPTETRIYDPDLEQLTIYSKGTNDPNNPVNLLTGDISSLKATFHIRYQERGGLDVFELQPVETGDTYTKIVFEFDDKKLKAIEFWDKLEQKTHINFHKVKLNKTMKEKDFEFIAPAGTDIIRNE